jgi:hypothetical protein
MFPKHTNTYSLKKYIYIFELIENRRFLYSSFQKEESLLILEATLYYDFLKKYPVIKITYKKEQKTGFDIDILTKEYMYYYGIHYVRGGSYVEEVLSEQQEMILIEELKTVDNAEQKPKEYFITLLLQEYKDQFTKKEEVDEEIIRITKKRKQYNIEKDRLSKFKECSRWIYTFGDHINNLRLECNKICHKEFDTAIYKDILKKINIVYLLLSENFPEILEKQENGDLIYCKYPEFLFDSFIYRSGLGSLDSLESVSRLCNLFIYFGEFLLNRIEEYEFDIACYGYEDDWTFSRRLYYLVNYSF